MVEDQERALNFYTTILGFKKVADIPVGEYRWLTVASPEGVEGIELLLEPMDFAPARVYQKALFDAGIAATSFTTNDIFTEYVHLKKLGVKFRSEPIKTEIFSTVLFEDTCGNLISLVQAENVNA